MAEHPRPKKKRKVKSEKLHLDIRKKWESLIQTVDKHEVPIDVLDSVDIALIDGTTVSINIQHLIDIGCDSFEVEQMLNEKFEDLEEYIMAVDFNVNVGFVQSTVQPETDKVLKHL